MRCGYRFFIGRHSVSVICDWSAFSTKQPVAQRLLHARSDQITELKCGERDGICGGSCSSMEEKRGLLFRDAGIAVDEEGGLQEDRSKYKKWGGKGGKKSKKRGKYKLGSTKGQKVKKKVKKGSTKGQNVKIEGGKGSTKGGKQQKYMKKNRKYRKKEKKLQSEQEGPKLSKVTQIKEADRIQKYAQPVKSDENHRGKAP